MRIVLLTAGILIAASHLAEAQVILIQEDFEGLPLAAPIEDPTPPPTPGQGVVTPTPPNGWTVDRSMVAGINGPPTDNGIIDFAGWVFADRQWWVNAAADQGRSGFTKAAGTIAVADNDEWDDALHPGKADTPPTPGRFFDPNLRFTSFMSTTASSVGNIPANRVNLVFDSSWLPEFDDEWGTTVVDGQEALIRVSFDGGPTTDVLHWTSLAGDPNFHGDAPNETVSLVLPNPANFNQMTVTFGMLNAQNDWWWAIDNVVSFVQADPAVLTINTVTGEAVVSGGDVFQDAMTSYEITSAMNSLVPAGLNGFSAKNIDPIDGEFDPDSTPGNGVGETWDVVNASTGQILEAFLLGSSIFDLNRQVSLGNIYNTSVVQDPTLEFVYTQPSGVQVTGEVQYIAELTADFDNDGDVDGADLAKWRLDFRVNGNSDADGDGDSDGADFLAWQRQLGMTASVGSSASVPEPSTLIQVIAITLAAAAPRRHRPQRVEELT